VEVEQSYDTLLVAVSQLDARDRSVVGRRLEDRLLAIGTDVRALRTVYQNDPSRQENQ